MDKIRVFLSKIRTLFSISKRAGEVSPLPLICTPVSVAEYASLSLNILENENKMKIKCMHNMDKSRNDKSR